MNFAISFYLITGMMLGIEIQKDPEDGHSVLVIDLFIARFMFEVFPDED